MPNHTVKNFRFACGKFLQIWCEFLWKSFVNMNLIGISGHLFVFISGDLQEFSFLASVWSVPYRCESSEFMENWKNVTRAFSVSVPFCFPQSMIIHFVFHQFLSPQYCASPCLISSAFNTCLSLSPSFLFQCLSINFFLEMQQPEKHFFFFCKEDI